MPAEIAIISEHLNDDYESILLTANYAAIIIF